METGDLRPSKAESTRALGKKKSHLECDAHLTLLDVAFQYQFLLIFTKDIN